MNIYIKIVGKMQDQHFNVSLLSNPGHICPCKDILTFLLSTAVQLVFNPFSQLVPQLELYSQLQLSLWSDPIAFSVLVLWTVIGGRVGYHGWTEFCYDWLKLD